MLNTIREEIANLSAIVYLYLCGYCSEVSSSSGGLGWAALFLSLSYN